MKYDKVPKVLIHTYAWKYRCVTGSQEGGLFSEWEYRGILWIWLKEIVPDKEPLHMSHPWQKNCTEER